MQWLAENWLILLLGGGMIGMTGEILHVDAGFHVNGMVFH